MALRERACCAAIAPACTYRRKRRRSVGDTNVTLALIADGWHTYQAQLCEALATLTAEQLALRAAPQLRSSMSWRATSWVCVRAGSTWPWAQAMTRSARTAPGTERMLRRGRRVSWCRDS